MTPPKSVAGRVRQRLAQLPTSLTARNAASNFLALVWLSGLSLVTVPLYIRQLGAAEWGLVAACTSLQIVLNFFDAGFSQIVPRWAAREAHQPARLAAYLRLLRRVYVGLGLLVFLLIQAAAAALAQQWFQVPADRAPALEWAIRIFAFQLFFQFVNNLHIGLWHGLQQQVLANRRVCGFGSLKHGLALTLVLCVAPHAWLYTLAFASVALLELLCNAWTVQRHFGAGNPKAPAAAGMADDGARPQTIPLRPLLREVATLSGGILVGLLVSQLDRILLSRSVSLQAFGTYTVVASLAMAFLQLQTPITRAYFPLLVQDIQRTGWVSGARLRRMLLGTVLVSTLPALLACALASHLLTLWLHVPEMVRVGTLPLQMLLVAVALNTLYGCIYQVMVAKGEARRVLQFNLVALGVAGLACATLGLDAGLVLGGTIWLSNSMTQLVLGSLWLLKNRPPGA